MKGWLVILLFAGLQTAKPLFTIPSAADYIQTDNLGNLYLIQGYNLLKYASDGTLMFTYSDNFSGHISSVSIGEGLKVLVYYRETARLAVLDNSLSLLSPVVDLNFYNLGTVTLATSSVQNSYWFYDPLQGALIRTTNTFTEIYNSGNLDQMLNYHIDPNFMVEFANKLYLNDPENGILVFDIFGTYLKTIPLKGLKRFEVVEKGIYYTLNGQLNFYDLRDFVQINIPLPEKPVQQALVSNKLMFIKTTGKVSAWDLDAVLK